MAIKEVGFGGTGSSTYETLSTLINEFAPERYENAINNAAPLLGSGALKKVPVPGDEWRHTIYGGAVSSTALVRDGGRLPVGMTKIPHKLIEQPCNIVSILTMGRRATKSRMSDDGLSELFDSALEESSEDCSRVLARSLHGGAVSPQAGTTWSGTAADSTVTINFLDISFFKPDAAYDFVDTSESLAYVVRCTDVVPAAVGANSDAVAGSASFINDVPNPATGSVVALGATAVATADVFRIRGETAGFGAASTTVDTALNTFTDISGTAALHGKAATDIAGHRGATKALAAAYSQEAIVQFMGRMHTMSGHMPDVAIMHPQMGAAHMAHSGQQAAVFGLTAGLSAARPMQLDKSFDKFGNVFEKGGLTVGGAKVVLDPNHPATAITLYNSEKTKLAVWDEMGPDEEAGDSLLLGRQFFNNECQISGGYNLVNYRRSTVGVITGITGL
jgi:hypothetical protein